MNQTPHLQLSKPRTTHYQNIIEENSNMTYVLEKITQEDQGKIILESSENVILNRDLVFTKNEEIFPETWAIDRKNNYYLYIKPAIVRPENTGCSYCFYFNGKSYEIILISPFSNEMIFKEKTQYSLLEEIKCEIKSAFLVFGRGGHGPKNEFGQNEFLIDPEFKEEQVASSPYGVQRNTGHRSHEIPDSAKLHPGYLLK